MAINFLSKSNFLCSSSFFREDQRLRASLTLLDGQNDVGTSEGKSGYETPRLTMFDAKSLKFQRLYTSLKELGPDALVNYLEKNPEHAEEMLKLLVKDSHVRFNKEQCLSELSNKINLRNSIKNEKLVEAIQAIAPKVFSQRFAPMLGVR